MGEPRVAFGKGGLVTEPPLYSRAGVSMFVYSEHLSINRLSTVFFSSITGSVNMGQLILLFVTSDQRVDGKQHTFKCNAERDRIVEAAFPSPGDSVKQTSKRY